MIKKLPLYLHLLWQILVGNLLKLKVRANLYLLHRIPRADTMEKGLIISLTSYGKRVTNNSVAFTAYSLLAQTCRAERVILWLDEKEFSDQKLPPMLHLLKKHGLEVRYCPNYRSFKKLLPTLQLAPEANVITADDDMYYTSGMVAELVKAHHQHPKTIITQTLNIPTMTETGYAPYTAWHEVHHFDESTKFNRYLAMPMGGYGTLYPAHIFDQEVLNYDAIRELCPQADDLWFYVMGLRGHIRKQNVLHSRTHYYHLDLLRQILTKDRLHDTNFGEGQNDRQLRNLIEHYKIDINELRQHE